MISVGAAFDPISKAELDACKALHKQYGEVYLCLSKSGVLPYEERLLLVKRAIRPFRHLHIGSVKKPDLKLDETDEKEIRKGSFYLAAPGIRNLLNERMDYYPQIVEANCKPHRAVHTYGVAETAQKLAHWHNLDERQAYAAGMLHDITKKWSDEKGRKVIAVYAPEWLTISPKVWHSYTASVWLQKTMCIQDQKVLHAIAHHTIGDGNSDLDRIVYIADKIEPNRGYDTTMEFALARKSLSLAAEQIRKESAEYRKKEKN